MEGLGCETPSTSPGTQDVPVGDTAAPHPSSGHCQQWWELGAADSQGHSPCRATGIPAPSGAVGSCSVRRHFTGHDVPARDPSPSLHANLLMRSRFSSGSQALIPIKPFHVELAVAQAAGYGSCRGASGRPPAEARSWEAPAKAASGSAARGAGLRAGGSFGSHCLPGDEKSISQPSSMTGRLCPGAFAVPTEGALRAGAGQPAGREGLHRGAEGPRPPAARC